MSRELDEKLIRVLQIQEELEIRKRLYDELDKLTLELQAAGWTSGALGEVKLELVDNFLTKNTVFRVAGVHRWEIREVKPKKEAK